MGNLEDFNVDSLRLGRDEFDAFQRQKRLKPEQRCRADLQSVLRSHFHIDDEVRGTHSPTGRRLRLDMMLRPKNVSEWANPGVSIGVEIKRKNNRFKDTKDYCKHLAQSFDYTNTCWDGFGFVCVFAYPTIVPPWSKDAHLIHRICGQMGVGVIEDNSLSGITFLLNEHTIWSESRGVVEGNRWQLKRKFGSR